VILSALGGEPPRVSSGQWEADWIYIDDVVDGFLAAGCTPGTEGLTIDLGSGALTSVRAVVQKIIELTDHKVQAIFGAHRDRPFEQVRVADTELAHAVLGWKATTSLAEGLARTVDWLRRKMEEDARW
jgi:nucleoside-diphosphate-sugar epimerase